MDNTAVSSGFLLRVIMLCSPLAIRTAAKTGSRPICGIAACAPTPLTRISNSQLAAITGPLATPKVPAGSPGRLCRPKTAFTGNRLNKPSSTIARAPAPSSSAGWKIRWTAPSKSRRRARERAAPSSIAVWPSCPHACIFPAFCERCAKAFCSCMGSASISARSPIARADAPARSVPTTPVLRSSRCAWIARRIDWISARACSISDRMFMGLSSLGIRLKTNKILAFFGVNRALRSIKMAGFKSFVEPAHFQVPGQRVGIVGPNGCGKSNVIDAVRWVLGESRAAELRGESMQDVIFNGSGARPPARRASVELVFENDGNDESGKAGPWSQYAEIAVKRVLTRNGASQYVINQQNVRRRDVQDIFLGTGLGPRAYAISGQGMIARLIEAKPEELRIFLEEAAGVSKYKERRRETENRLSDARENLTRVEDIRRELGANLDKLERQAARAQQYQALRAEYEETQHLLWRIQKNEAQAEVEQQQRLLNEAQAALEAHSAQLRGIEARLGTLRAEHGRANETVSGAQRALYEAQAELSRF